MQLDEKCGNTRIIPEWRANNPLIINNGAELHWVINGVDEVVGIYYNGHFVGVH